MPEMVSLAYLFITELDEVIVVRRRRSREWKIFVYHCAPFNLLIINKYYSIPVENELDDLIVSQCLIYISFSRYIFKLYIQL